ncbi:hypothetical protein E2C01_087369 [Portunus trituberculatus]|uniref:Uncharacterized protein n=1 Tax=Portunus trituberculatus TaxID=210409 RepID=A0A5B7J6F0_PORTR|nr:hypothetical protein [Portunus trituberculatus]
MRKKNEEKIEIKKKKGTAYQTHVPFLTRATSTQQARLGGGVKVEWGWRGGGVEVAWRGEARRGRGRVLQFGLNYRRGSDGRAGLFYMNNLRRQVKRGVARMLPGIRSRLELAWNSVRLAHNRNTRDMEGGWGLRLTVRPSHRSTCDVEGGRGVGLTSEQSYRKPQLESRGKLIKTLIFVVYRYERLCILCVPEDILRWNYTTGLPINKRETEYFSEYVELYRKVSFTFVYTYRKAYLIFYGESNAKIHRTDT